MSVELCSLDVIKPHQHQENIKFWL